MNAQRKLSDDTIAQGIVVLQPNGDMFDSAKTKVQFADGVDLDEFGRLRTSVSNTIFDSQQEYGLDTVRIWDALANGTFASPSSNGSASNAGNAVGPVNVATRLTPITVTGTDGHYAVLQSRQYMRYVPGNSHLVLLTGVFAHTPDCAMSFALRSSTSGSPVDDEVARSDWSYDKFDGLGPSGVKLDFSKTQILFISAAWLGIGPLTMGFKVGQKLLIAHQFAGGNKIIVPYSQTFNLPVRMEGRTVAGESSFRSGYFDGANGAFLKATGIAGGTAQFNCASVASENGEFPEGVPNATPVISTKAATARIPLISIRPKATFNGRTNRAHIEMIEYSLRTRTNDAQIEVILGGTLTGANFQSVDKCCRYTFHRDQRYRRIDALA